MSTGKHGKSAKNVQYLHGEIFCPHVKFQFTWIRNRIKTTVNVTAQYLTL